MALCRHRCGLAVATAGLWMAGLGPTGCEQAGSASGPADMLLQFAADFARQVLAAFLL